MSEDASKPGVGPKCFSCPSTDGCRCVERENRRNLAIVVLLVLAYVGACIAWGSL